MSIDIFLVFFLFYYFSLIGITHAQTSSKRPELINQTQTEEIEPNSLILQSASPDNLHHAINSFTQNIYLHIAQASNEDNFVFSPLSLHSALAMLFMATTNHSVTRDQLGNAIGYISNPDVLAASYKEIIDSYTNQKSFLYGNHIWISEDLLIDPEYKEIVIQNFKSEVSNLQFDIPESVDIINNWVREKTNNKIKKLVDAFSPPPEMFLANALYFNEKWLVPFQDTTVWGESVDTDFQTDNGPVNIPLMLQESRDIGFDIIKYGNSSQEVEVITLPYENRNFDMQIIMPTHFQILEHSMEMKTTRDHSGEDIDNSLFSELKNISLPYWSEVELKMPTFKVKTKMDAAEALKNLGAKRMFTEDAELGRLVFSEPLRVSNILHSAVVEVTKEGTEGAAATGIPSPSQSIPRILKITIDRPFIFVVRDKINQIPILVGRVKDPTKPLN